MLSAATTARPREGFASAGEAAAAAKQDTQAARGVVSEAGRDVAACADKVAMLFGFTGAAVDDSAGASCLEVRAWRAHICHFVCSGSISLSGESHFLAGEDFHYNGNLRLNGTAIPHSVLSTCTRNDC